MVGGFYGMLLLSATCPRLPGRREKVLTKGDSENHSRLSVTDLGNGLNIIRFLQETSQGFTSLVRKVLPGIFFGYELIAGICGMEIFWSQI